MKLHKIIKQQLLAEPFSKDAQKLACAIYSTYIENDENLYMKIQLQTIERILKLQTLEDPHQYVKMLLEELREPIAVKNFKYFAQTYPVRVLRFFTYTLDSDFLEIELNEEFLHAEQEYAIKRFLSC